MQAHFSDEDRLHQRLERFGVDVQFALDHREEWRLAFPDHWIAVYDSRLIATALGRDELFDIAKGADVPLADTYIDFVPRGSPFSSCSDSGYLLDSIREERLREHGGSG
ncbi:MAG: hypothetical protein AB7G38_15385 [Dehalococcoidia bacterium]